MTVTFDPAVFRGVRIVVLGGTGFLGRRTVERLLAYGAVPILLCRTKPRGLPDGWRGRVVVYDDPIATLKTVSEALANCFAFNEAAGAINLAAAGVLPQERDPNALAAANGLLAETVAKTVGELCAELPPVWPGSTLLHVGSALEYGLRPASLDEAAPAAPDEPYGRSKLRGTKAVLRARAEHGLAALVARPFTVFGPGEAPTRLLPSLVARAGDDGPIELTAGLQRRDFAYVDDVADALVRLLAAPRKAVAAGEGPFDAGIVNVATGVSVAVREFVRAAAHEFHLDEGRLRFGALPTRADDTEHPPTPVARLVAALGAPLSADLSSGLRRTHRRLLASLYEKPPASDERKTEPAGGRPPAPKEAPRRRGDRPRPAPSAGADGAPPGAR